MKFRDENFEFTARDVAFLDIAEEQWDRTQRGALVEEVKPGGWAELGSLYVGDLILEMDGQAVTDVDSLKKLAAQIAAKKASSVVMKVQRGIHTEYLELEPSWKD
jgi:S1-C subfamily serine protease